MNFPSKKTCFKAKSIGLLLFSIIFSISCSTHTADSNASGNNRTNSNTIATENSTICNDDISSLGNLVLLPFVPEEVCFVEENIKNTNDKKLTAVLKMTAEDAYNLSQQAAKHRPAETVEIGAEKWFPEELVAQSQLSGNALLKSTAFAPTDFIQLPYKNGRLIKVENSNYFVLELATN